MRISRDQAREYFLHHSQQLYGITPDNLPDDPFEYWARGGVCGVLHQMPAPGVWMVHIAVKPQHWGGLVADAKAELAAFWADRTPSRIIGWTPAKFRAALAFSRRVGFVEDGRMNLPDGEVIMSGWRA